MASRWAANSVGSSVEHWAAEKAAYWVVNSVAPKVAKMVVYLAVRWVVCLVDH